MRKEIENDGKWIIEFETNDERFYLYQINEGNKEKQGGYESYENTQKAINRAETIKKKKIVPLPFIKTKHHNNEYEKGKITSLAEDKSYGVYVWVSVDKSRSKIGGEQLKDTIENEAILNKVKELEEEITKEKKKFEYYTYNDLRKHFSVD